MRTLTYIFILLTFGITAQKLNLQFRGFLGFWGLGVNPILILGRFYNIISFLRGFGVLGLIQF